ncbi:MAG: hypothetical protein GX225_05650 [Clostridiales bacterium]|nr:hypothetical protein [Clostridiales bacterium]
MNLYEIGSFCKSKAGHDKDEIFIILREAGEYVYLIDGCRRKIANPKRKKKKHIEPTSYIYNEVKDKIKESVIRDCEVRKFIRRYKMEVMN